MGDFSEWEMFEMVELEKEIEESGVSNIEEFVRKRLEKWRELLRCLLPLLAEKWK